ncbi:MAG: S9 family peptidase [Methylococcales bacterium]|nr:MAG: S9 family peptidase [Methylococcales bacterium]
MKLRRYILLFVIGLSGCQSNLSNVAPINVMPLKAGELPIEFFAQMPLFEKMKLSPDGKTLAYIQNENGKAVLITRDLDGLISHKLLVTDYKESFVTDYSWVNNERLLIRIKEYLQFGDIKTYGARLFAVNKDGSERNDNLVKFSKNDNFSQNQDNFTLINNDPNHVFLELDINHRGIPDVYKLDIYSGAKEKIANNQGWIRAWVYDTEGKVRIGIGFKGATYTVAHRFNSDDDWKILSEKESFKVLGFDENPDILYITDLFNGKSAVYKLNLRTNNKELLLANKDYDIPGNLVRSSDRKHVIGIKTADKIEYFDKEAKELQNKINKVLPDTLNIIVSNTSKKHLVYSSSAHVAPRFYLYDESNNILHDVAEAYPDLKKEFLTKTNTVKIRVRDGIEMEAYLTQPSNNVGKPAPVIIFPHGGPWHNVFNIWTQFFANRGWTVLQVNFRGSYGFGEEFKSQGFKQWGLKMQDDIIDATKWAINNNIADKQKICIVGASYSGYAALMGLIKSPELYQCAISFAPVTDLTLLVDTLSDSRLVDSDARSKMADTRIGDSWSDSDRLKATSPVNLTKNITKPLLIAHGIEDRNVLIEHSRKFVSELKDNGFKNYEYLEFEHSDHYLLVEQDRIQFFRAMDSFLKKYH